MQNFCNNGIYLKGLSPTYCFSPCLASPKYQLCLHQKPSIVPSGGRGTSYLEPVESWDHDPSLSLCRFFYLLIQRSLKVWYTSLTSELHRTNCLPLLPSFPASLFSIPLSSVFIAPSSYVTLQLSSALFSSVPFFTSKHLGLREPLFFYQICSLLLHP